MIEQLLQIVTTYQLFGWVAFGVTVALTPIAARVARATGVMDYPDTFLKPHARPIPYLGGTAICLGWLVAVLVAAWAGRFGGGVMQTLPFVLGGVAMSILGLLDDAHDFSAKLRLLIGAVVIGGVLAWSNTGLGLLGPVFTLAGVEASPAVVTAISLPVSVFIVLGACNSTNLIDGLDGLASGVTFIISLGFFLLAALLATFRPEEPGHAVRLVLAIAMAGATLGFLPHNFNPARIFMGDAGSVLLGFNCGVLILLFAEWGNYRWVLGALMIFALPIFDTVLAMYRRFRAGRPIFEGDRSHIYDQLVQRGLTVKQAVLVCYALTAFFALVGLLVIGIRLRYAVAVYIVVCVAAWLIVQATRMANPDRPKSAPGEQ